MNALHIFKNMEEEKAYLVNHRCIAAPMRTASSSVTIGNEATYWIAGIAFVASCNLVNSVLSITEQQML